MLPDKTSPDETHSRLLIRIGQLQHEVAAQILRAEALARENFRLKRIVESAKKWQKRSWAKRAFHHWRGPTPVARMVSTTAESTSAICCMALDEDEYIEEWIQYNLGLGFDHVHIYDNSRENRLIHLNATYANRVHVIHFPGKHMQIPAYNYFLNTHRNDYTFAAFIDCDEFIVLKKAGNIKEFLMQHNPEVGVALNWVFFGHNFQEKKQSGPVLERFIRRSATVDPFVKCIVRLERVYEYIDPHNPAVTDGPVRDVKGRVVKGSLHPGGDETEAVIFHFWTKSREEFEKKIARGRSICTKPLSMLDFELVNDVANKIVDHTALDFFKARCREISK